jgi:hypothetical protein
MKYLVFAASPDVLAERHLLGSEVEVLGEEGELLRGGVHNEVGGEGDPKLAQLLVLPEKEKNFTTLTTDKLSKLAQLLDLPEKEKNFTTLTTDKLSKLAQLFDLPEKEKHFTTLMTDKLSEIAQLLVLPEKEQNFTTLMTDSFLSSLTCWTSLRKRNFTTLMTGQAFSARSARSAVGLP